MPAGGNWKEMFHAAEKGDLELVRYHLSTGIDPNYQHPEYTTGALLESIRKGQLEVAELLLEKGAKFTGHKTVNFFLLTFVVNYLRNGN